MEISVVVVVGHILLVENHTERGHVVGEVPLYDIISYQGVQKLLNRRHNMNWRIV